MPDRLSPAQIRGARGMLDWTMLDLALAARMSVSTIKRVESGVPQPVSDDIYGLIRDALEAHGMRFLTDDGNGLGMRLRKI